MADTQQRQEEQANCHREPTTRFKVEDKVWLNLSNIRTDQPSKKFDARNTKYTVIEEIELHDYCLDTLSGIDNVFHVSLLCPASEDLFPSQTQTDWQPPAVLTNPEQQGEDAEY